MVVGACVGIQTEHSKKVVLCISIHTVATVNVAKYIISKSEKLMCPTFYLTCVTIDFLILFLWRISQDSKLSLSLYLKKTVH